MFVHRRFSFRSDNGRSPYRTYTANSFEKLQVGRKRVATNWKSWDELEKDVTKSEEEEEEFEDPKLVTWPRESLIATE